MHRPLEQQVEPWWYSPPHCSPLGTQLAVSEHSQSLGQDGKHCEKYMPCRKQESPDWQEVTPLKSAPSHWSPSPPNCASSAVVGRGVGAGPALGGFVGASTGAGAVAVPSTVASKHET